MSDQTDIAIKELIKNTSLKAIIATRADLQQVLEVFVENLNDLRDEETARLEEIEQHTLCILHRTEQENERLRARLAEAVVERFALESQCQRMRDAMDAMEEIESCHPSRKREVTRKARILWMACKAPLDLELLNRVIKVLEMSHDRALDWDMLGRAHGNSAVQMWRESAYQLLKSLSPAP